MKKQKFTAIIHQEGKLFVAECSEVGTVSQGETEDEALKNLIEATELYLEDFPMPVIMKTIIKTFDMVSHA
ncbi:MAG: hypothetical protein A2Y33_05665 [Spirochaetes bacterium GWF1_51_8]|nr:MAG: hypothetical protein A2Y33_05665 [Spirochaetes bacterium GWF1_51_8]